MSEPISFRCPGSGDVRRKSLLEPQCHIGPNSISLARMGVRPEPTSRGGARHCPRARRGLGVDARFVRANVYDLPRVLDGEFDMVFTE
jgi:hypothetical protein